MSDARTKAIEDVMAMQALMKAFKSNDASSLEVCNFARAVNFEGILSELHVAPSAGVALTEGQLLAALRPVVSDVFNRFGSLSRGQALQMLVDAVRPVAPSATERSWIPWNGGPAPVGQDVMVEIKFRDGTIHYDCDWIWQHNQQEDDIVAYRFVGDSATKNAADRSNDHG